MFNAKLLPANETTESIDSSIYGFCHPEQQRWRPTISCVPQILECTGRQCVALSDRDYQTLTQEDCSSWAVFCGFPKAVLSFPGACIRLTGLGVDYGCRAASSVWNCSNDFAFVKVAGPQLVTEPANQSMTDDIKLEAATEKKEDSEQNERLSISRVSYNTAFLHRCLWTSCTRSDLFRSLPTPQLRARKILEQFQAGLNKYDIIALQEVFDPKAQNIIVTGLRNLGYYVAYDIAKTNAVLLGLGLSSGLLVASKYPIIDTQFRRYKDLLGEDSRTHKGAVGVKIKVNDQYFATVFNTHTQAGSGLPRGFFGCYLKECFTDSQHCATKLRNVLRCIWPFNWCTDHSVLSTSQRREANLLELLAFMSVWQSWIQLANATPMLIIHDGQP